VRVPCYGGYFCCVHCISTKLIDWCAIDRSSGDGRLRPLPSSNDLPTQRTRTSTSSTSQSHLQHSYQQPQQPHPLVSTRVDQITSRHPLKALQPVRPLPTAGSASGWLAGRKSSALDEDSLDRLVEINARQLANRGIATTTRSLSTVRRPPQTTHVVASPSTVYSRSKALPVTNNVAKPFSAGRNY